MRVLEFVKWLEELEKPVITINDVCRIIRKEQNYSSVFINRLLKQKYIKKIERGKYCLPDTSPFAVSSNLIFPSYLSFLSALNYYNLTTQISNTLLLVSLKQKNELLYENYKIKIIKFSRERFFGFKRVKIGGKILYVGEIEKVIVDSLHLPKYCPITETFFALNDGKYKKNKLISYALRFKSNAVIKRLGYLLELLGKDIYSDVKDNINNKYDLLNPFTKKGEKNKKWKLIVGEVLK